MGIRIKTFKSIEVTNMLKNNKERLNYYYDADNWIVCDYVSIKQLDEKKNMPFVRLLNLKGTGLFKVQMMLDTHYSPVHYATVSTYIFDDKGHLTSIYEVNQKALLDYLKGI